MEADSTKLILHPTKKLDFKQIGTQIAKFEGVKNVSSITDSEELIVEFTKKDKKTIDNLKIKNQDYDVSFAYRYSKKYEMLPTGLMMLIPKNRVKITEIVERFKNKIENVSLPLNGYYVIKPKKNDDLFSLANEIYESGLVDWCHPDFAVPIKKHSIPIDPFYANQYYLKPNATNTNFHINVEKAWAITKGTPNIKVAVIDDGVEPHDDLPNLMPKAGVSIELNNNGYGTATGGITSVEDGKPRDSAILPTYKFDGEEGILYHGQAVAGIIGASHNNIGIAGVAPNVSIFPINVYTSTKQISGENGTNREWLIRYSGLAKAIDEAKTNGCNIINMSMGLLEIVEATPGIPAANSTLLDDAIKNVVTPNSNFKGIPIIVSIGNYRALNDASDLTYPANNELTIGVGASTATGGVAWYSKKSKNVDLVAPSGENSNNIWTIDRMGDKGFNLDNYMSNFGGTSASAPQVAGVAALMLSVNPNLTPTEIETILKAKAKSLGQPAEAQGAGLVQACESVVEAINMSNGPLYFTGNTNIAVNAFSNSSTQIELKGIPSGYKSITWQILQNAAAFVTTSTSGTGSIANLTTKPGVSGSAKIAFTVNYNCVGTINIPVTKLLKLDFVTPLNSENLDPGCYQIFAKHSGKALAVSGAQATNGASIWQEALNNNLLNQIWKVDYPLGIGNYYNILAPHTGKAMEVMNASTSALANIQQNDYVGGYNQLFTINRWVSDGTWKIKPRHISPQTFNLDIYGGSNANFVQLKQNQENGLDNQRFYFEPIGCPTAGSITTCGMSISNVLINCYTGNPNVQNIIEDVTVNGVTATEPLQYRVDAGNWLDYCWLIQNLSPGNHYIYVRKKNNITCQTNIQVAVCFAGSSAGPCPVFGCIPVSGVIYNASSKVLETVNASGGSGQYQYAIDGCGTWLNYQWLIQNLSNGNHTVYVRDKLNITCGGQFTFNVTGNNFRIAADGATTIEEDLNLGLEVYPNPTESEINITFKEEQNDKLKLEILSINGKVFKIYDLIGTGAMQAVKVDFTRLQAGSYVVSLKSSKSVKSKIIIKQ